jgi:pyridoxamine 5'-phosphate oxidase
MGPFPGPAARARIARLRHLEDMRGFYAASTLDEAEFAGDWLAQFERWLDDALNAPLPEPNAMVLATADAAGRPSARNVLLKLVDARGFVLYTNLDSRKGRDVAANPHGALVFTWTPLHRQVVVTGTVEHVEDAEADAYFASRPHGSRLGALASSQSAVIPSRAVLDEARAELEQRYPEGAVVPRPANWGGLRVVPETVEFWQGRPDRLHDRLRFRREHGGAWTVERLAP